MLVTIEANLKFTSHLHKETDGNRIDDKRLERITCHLASGGGFAADAHHYNLTPVR